jgi:hypothetical protein
VSEEDVEDEGAMETEITSGETQLKIRICINVGY